MMNEKIQQLKVRYRYSTILLRELVITDFKLRYQNSVLGYLWSLLRPFSQFTILYVVFVKIIPSGGDIPNFGVALLLGIVLWSYFTEVTNVSVGAIVGRGDLLRKVNFPRYVVILSISFSALINLFLNLIIVGIIMAINRVDISAYAVVFPLLLIELFVFSLAVSLLLSSLYVKYRDVNHIWDVLMQAAFFATPIMYAFTLVTSKSELVGKLLISNPVAQIIQDARHILISPKNISVADVFGTSWAYVIPLSIVVVVSVLSVFYFRNRSPYFAEEV